MSLPQNLHPDPIPTNTACELADSLNHARAIVRSALADEPHESVFPEEYARFMPHQEWEHLLRMEKMAIREEGELTAKTYNTLYIFAKAVIAEGPARLRRQNDQREELIRQQELVEEQLQAELDAKREIERLDAQRREVEAQIAAIAVAAAAQEGARAAAAATAAETAKNEGKGKGKKRNKRGRAAAWREKKMREKKDGAGGAGGAGAAGAASAGRVAAG
ncbi:uncharacterized protein K452DRAFT_312012 [Aplosporella prunicola CBS 121167]|uniref:Uncharacterized protein n=1 Tax=Aplosporella prunicola CBS 121167 TaxID=1176127 RepID=A0A6A6B3T9_9PEZI|nr:uncharacterized protein K452DRAFT_312012 [Aplosporella prunicola CBS 121167]KAF2137874.1 hypothetical protein K452DRAFT_312012 [Aplosporella prunicola CBS 121167]